VVSSPLHLLRELFTVPVDTDPDELVAIRLGFQIGQLMASNSFCTRLAYSGSICFAYERRPCR